MPAPPIVPATAGQLLIRSFIRNRPAILLSLLLRGVHQVGELGVPLLIGVIIDKAISTADVGQLLFWLAVLGADFLVLSLGWRFGARFDYDATQRETHLLRGEIAAHVLHDRGARTEQLPGELLSVATSDADKAASSINCLGWFATGVMAITITAVALLVIDVRIGLVIALGLPACLALMQFVTPMVTQRSKAEQSTIGKASALASDLIRGLRPLKGIGSERQAAGRYVTTSQRAKEARLHTVNAMGLMFGGAGFVSTLFLAIVAGMGGSAAINGDISIGQLVAMVGLVQYLSEPAYLIGESTAEFGRARASAQRVVDVLATPRLIGRSGGVPARREGRLAVKDLNYGVLNGLSFETRPGELLGVVVSDAAASNDLIRVFSGEVEPHDRTGRVLIDDMPIEDLSMAARHDRILVSMHHVDLFEGTLRSNIAVGDGELGPILTATAADDVANLDPLGIDQPVTDRGATLSGGQRQRIALARALMADAPTLVLQDPTTAVDAITEQLIAAGIRAIRHDSSGRSTVILTNSPSLLANADRVLHVVDGTVVAEGRHANLLGEDLGYRNAVLR